MYFQFSVNFNCMSYLQFNKSVDYIIIGPRREKPCLRDVANNTGADQPTHRRSQISTFFIRFMKNTICKLATREISIF